MLRKLAKLTAFLHVEPATLRKHAKTTAFLHIEPVYVIEAIPISPLFPPLSSSSCKNEKVDPTTATFLG